MPLKLISSSPTAYLRFSRLGASVAVGGWLRALAVAGLCLRRINGLWRSTASSRGCSAGHSRTAGSSLGGCRALWRAVAPRMTAAVRGSNFGLACSCSSSLIVLLVLSTSSNSRSSSLVLAFSRRSISLSRSSSCSCASSHSSNRRCHSACSCTAPCHSALSFLATARACRRSCSSRCLRMACGDDSDDDEWADACEDSRRAASAAFAFSCCSRWA
mmetsp:Transcript_76293/g.134675  ORF Transcript_76293/g.134675 Transcript_76293/m.134675 type:complete len:216 (-) Transcript_76293:386-1033(-)